MALAAREGDGDVCIVGAGAAGGILALELARRGIRVVVLESGPRHDFARRREYARRYLAHENPWRSPLAGHDLHSRGGSVPYDLESLRVRGVGGSTLHWEGSTLRFHADDFRLRSLHGLAEDWPIAYADLEPYYARAEAALGVAGAGDDPWASARSTGFPLPAFPLSYSDGVFARACRTLDIALHHLPQARNSVPYGGRAACQACSTCAVCPTGAKASVDLTHVAEATATGRVTVLAEATVLRLETDAAGAVRAAIYAQPDRVERRLTARIFIVAAGGIESARLLLLSTSPRFPRGLANGSGRVGRGFMAHPAIEVTGRTRENMLPHRIGFSTAMSRQFAVERDRRTRGAFLLEFLNSAAPTPERLAVESGLVGAALRRHVREEFGHRLGIRVYAEHLPDAANSITLNPRVRDYFGSPVPHITYHVGRYERSALDEAKDLAGRILGAAGATDVRPTRISTSAHQIGTHRMGADPATSVVDADCRAHEVGNLYVVGSGCFVTASASPPTLTIAALAIRAAGHVAGRLARSAA